ncbi:IS66 family insertion sequence element accessory protein TnpA [Desulfosediminicola flagellatus]|uniref:IS66 family insertion sequence element accessory protein TnpA n=1 Tax=Desulfosediminicola flagellatus TaxID=2569541 RepID=UPI003B82DEF4
MRIYKELYITIKQAGSRSDKQQKWAQHGRDCKECGLSQEDYCESHAIPLQSFGYWKRKLKKLPITQLCFYPLSIPAELNQTLARVVLDYTYF